MKICSLFRSVTFVVRFLGRFLAMFACGYSGVNGAAFFEKLSHFLAFQMLKSESSLQMRISIRN